MTDSEEAILRRIRVRSIAIGVSSAAVAFLFGWRAVLSLTISAAVVIFSFLALERLTGRLVPPQARKGVRAYLPLLLVTVAGLAILGAVIVRWKGFEPIAGAAGLSVIAVAIGLEVFERGGGGKPGP